MRVIKSALKVFLFFSPTIFVIGFVLFQKYRPLGSGFTYSLNVSDKLQMTDLSIINPEDSFKIEIAEEGPSLIPETLPFGVRIEKKPIFGSGYQGDVIVEFASDNQVQFSFVTWNPDERWAKLADNWRSLNLHGYQRAVRFNETYVYSREWKDWQRAASLEDWLIKNVDAGETVGVSEGVDLSLESLVNQEVDNIKPRTEGITLPWRIRGTVSFWIYVPGDHLNVSFTKRDINRYLGKDEYIFGLEDTEGNLIFSEVIKDDGNEEISYLDQPQNFTFSVDIPKKGVYRLVFESNKSRIARVLTSDSTIENLTVNADKLVTSGPFSLVDPASLYSKIDKLTQLKVKCKPESSGRLIEIEPEQGAPFSIKTPRTGEWYPSSLLAGGYTFQTNTALEFEGLAFSSTKDEYFQAFIYHFTNYSPRNWLTRLSQPEEKAVFENVYAMSAGELDDLLSLDGNSSWGVVFRELDSAGNLVVEPTLKIKSLEIKLNKPSIFSGFRK